MAVTYKKLFHLMIGEDITKVCNTLNYGANGILEYIKEPMEGTDD